MFAFQTVSLFRSSQMSVDNFERIRQLCSLFWQRKRYTYTTMSQFATFLWGVGWSNSNTSHEAYRIKKWPFVPAVFRRRGWHITRANFVVCLSCSITVKLNSHVCSHFWILRVLYGTLSRHSPYWSVLDDKKTKFRSKRLSQHYLQSQRYCVRLVFGPCLRIHFLKNSTIRCFGLSPLQDFICGAFCYA